MNLGEAVRQAWDAGGASRDWTSPAGIGELARSAAAAAGRPERYGNGILARELGVSIRTVQRWQKSGGEARSAAASPHARELRQLGTAADDRAKAQRARENGLSVSFRGTMAPGTYRQRTRDFTVELDPESEYFRAFLDQAAVGAGEDALGAAFWPALAEEYGIPSFGDAPGEGWEVGDVARLEFA